MLKTGAVRKGTAFPEDGAVIQKPLWYRNSRYRVQGCHRYAQTLVPHRTVTSEPVQKKTEVGDDSDKKA